MLSPLHGHVNTQKERRREGGGEERGEGKRERERS